MNSGTLDDGQTPITKEDIWNDPDKYSNFYDKAKKYWEGTPATVQGGTVLFIGSLDRMDD